MLTIHVAPDTSVELDCTAKGEITQAEFEELLNTALLSQDVIEFIEEHPKFQQTLHIGEGGMPFTVDMEVGPCPSRRPISSLWPVRPLTMS